MVLGIVAALAREAGGLAEPLPAGAGPQAISDEVLLTVSGMGARRARAAGESLIAEGATALLSWGSAGALHAELGPGSLLLPKRIVPVQGQDVAVDVAWHTRLMRALDGHMNVYTAPLAESSSVLRATDAKRSLRERTDAVAVDMESAALGALAWEAGLPFLVVRAVADAADMTVPGSVLGALDEDGGVHLVKLLGRLLVAPGDWVALGRLSRGFSKAQATLARVANQTGPGFLAPT